MTIFLKRFMEKELYLKIFFISSKSYKIKTILNIEIACLLNYHLLRTKLSANIVSISGVVWSLIGIIFLSFYNSFLFSLGIIIFFLKLITDYVDGQLAFFQKKISLTGHELDGWAGNMSTIIILSGFYLYGIGNILLKTKIYFTYYFYCFIFSFEFKIALSKFKKSYFDKKLQTHVSNEKKVKKNKFIKKNKSNFNDIGVSILMGSRYTDLLLVC